MAEKIVQTAGRDCSDNHPCHYVCGMAEGLGSIPPGKRDMELSDGG